MMTKLLKRSLSLVMALALAMSLCAVPAFADEPEVEGETHEHNQDGYVCTKELTCSLEEHTHSAACYPVICGQEEVKAHAHTTDCYAKTLICTLDESEGHTHTDSCYETTQTCELEESEDHTHTDSCYEVHEDMLECGLDATEGHAHSKEKGCYGTEPICGLDEHTHTDECYDWTCIAVTTDPRATKYYLDLTNLMVGDAGTALETPVANLQISDRAVTTYYDTEERDGYGTARRWYELGYGSHYRYSDGVMPEEATVGDRGNAKPIDDNAEEATYGPTKSYNKITINGTTYRYDAEGGTDTYRVVWYEVTDFIEGDNHVLHVKGYVVLNNEPNAMDTMVQLVLGLDNTVDTQGNQVKGAKVEGSAERWYWLDAATGTGSVTGSLPDTEPGSNGTSITENLDAKCYSIDLSSVCFPKIIVGTQEYTYDATGAKAANTYSVVPTELKAHNAYEKCSHSEKVNALHWHMGFQVVLNDGSDAKWVVTFEDGEGNTYETALAENNGTVTAPTVTREGYTLTGWRTADGQTWDVNATVTGDLTLTATWELNDVSEEVAPTPVVTNTPAADTDTEGNIIGEAVETVVQTVTTSAANAQITSAGNSSSDTKNNSSSASKITTKNNSGTESGDATGDSEPEATETPVTELEDEEAPMTELPEEETPLADLSDEDTPLAEAPETAVLGAVVYNEATELAEEDVPMAEVPETGDNQNAWTLMAGLSALGLVLLALSGRKRRENEAA